MRSLRSRLIVGAALIAVIPLALSMYILSRQIETTVRRESEARLIAALGGLQSDLGAETERVSEKLRLLGEDPVLKRLYLVRRGDRRELIEYLAERRFLVGLDRLQVMDAAGVVEADAASALRAVGEGAEGDSGLAVMIGTPIRYDQRIAGTLFGGIVLDTRDLDRLKRAGGMELVLRDHDGHRVAQTLVVPEAPPPVPLAGTSATRVMWNGRSYLARSFPLVLGAGTRATVTGLVPTEAADRTVGALRITSLLLGFFGLAIAMLLGSIWSAQISRPVERLAAFSREVARGAWDEPLRVESVRELETLVEALDTMRRDLSAYRERLLVSERQAAWSQMARRVAHEIKNPLTPIAVSIEDLRRSYDQGREDFPEVLRQSVHTIAEEISTMKRLLQEFSDFGRLPAPAWAPCRVGDLLDEVALLYGRDVTEGRLAVDATAGDVMLDADAGQLRQVLVNLVKNALEALDGTGPTGRASVSAVIDGTDLVFAVQDTGPGMSEEQRRGLFLPGFTTKPDGSGLGLTIVERIVNDHGGAITVDTHPGAGTTIRVRLPRGPRR
jgi:signal transduction histidine kinase